MCNSMTNIIKHIFMTILIFSFSCTNSEVTEKASPFAQDTASSSEISTPTVLRSKIDTIFSDLQGKWELVKKYTPPGDELKSNPLTLLIKNSAITKLNNSDLIWSDTLIFYNYNDSVSEYYSKKDSRVGFRFDKRCPTKLQLLFALGDGGGEDYIKVK
jgi:hypothetical protein